MCIYTVKNPQRGCSTPPNVPKLGVFTWLQESYQWKKKKYVTFGGVAHPPREIFLIFAF